MCETIEIVELTMTSVLDEDFSYNNFYEREQFSTENHHNVKLGWIEGVLNPCLLSMWGVMLFLQLPWIVGQAGIRDSLGIIFISTIIIVITTFSLSAISSNGQVKGGGLYFLISRSIGPELGASLGILFAFANTIVAALNTLGFSMSLNTLLQTYNIHFMNSSLVLISIGIASIILMGIICCMGMDDEAKVQNLLVAIIVVAIFDVIIGSIIGPKSLEAKASGFTGFSMDTFLRNWHPDYRSSNNNQETFFTIFAIFFPAVTGIQAGANICGDLKNPSIAIPKGTLWSILISITSYVALVVVTGSVQLREASGDVSQYINGSYLNCSNTNNCKHGLSIIDDNIMQSLSLWPNFIYFGCFAATISTALTSLIAVPKILQRMGQDNVHPFLSYLSVGYGKTNEPYRAHFATVLLASAFMLVGNLNALASFSSSIYLCTYALLNICTFHVAYYNPVGWRPSFKFYNKWLSLFGCFACFVIMFYVDNNMSIIISCLLLLLYAIASRKKYDLNWGSSMQYRKFKNVLKHVYKINSCLYHVKNYSPNILLLSGSLELRKHLVYFASSITKNNGLLMCVNVKQNRITSQEIQNDMKNSMLWLKAYGIKCLYNILDGISLNLAVRMIYLCSYGQLKPNIIFMGFKSDWKNCSDDDLQSYFSIFKTSIYYLNKNEKHFSLGTKMNKNNVVDIWWLNDDGGLALIITHMLKCCNEWKKCKFRIFGVAKIKENVATEKERLIELLSMYRIEFDAVEVILINSADNHLVKSDQINSEQEFGDMEDMFVHYLHLKNLIESRSRGSSLVILSIVKPNKLFYKLHMYTLDSLTDQLESSIILSGNVLQTITANA
ncbi:bumetanide-sensitive sodium-(potassium)-chloride cotransporter-like isoform X2 [Daktulosphaira vitifoliae]|uniref:bumetanide-sensitive sodium-(potassium)-chloride cotransporter-like isoform X2 n=1 Tax=Daktulosphaira vitifoliae TaxID=58002 RepID=UPI0021A9FB8A|nr:bumetanide-sensitive sodium-(potassium)-chloride cotransporter-like isoform X2 [Daktulosphaira vitifoliae]